MPRRVNLPPADELFRKTTPETKPAAAAGPDEASDAAGHASGPSGRIRHTEKMTVYLTSEELLALEQARLKLRAELGRTIDRGRLVRAALDYALGDRAERGTDSEIARRLAAS